MNAMARGWESKSVEEQQSEHQAPLTTETRERLERQAADKARRVQTLKLSIARIREQVQRTQSERYLELLNREIAHLEAELARLQ